MSNNGGEFFQLSGRIDFRDRAARMSNSSGAAYSTYLPYETVFVGGWNYVPIDIERSRPPTLRAGAVWVAFREGYLHALPVPGPFSPPGLLFEDLDGLLTGHLVDARFVGPAADSGAQVELKLPSVSSGAASAGVWTLSIDPRGRIAEIKFAVPKESEVLLTLSYMDSVPKIAAPPSDRVQRLAPTDNLYPSRSTTTLAAV